jgi:hypothetical protein
MYRLQSPLLLYWCRVHYQEIKGKTMERPLGLLEVQTPRISTQSANEDGKVVSPTHRPPLFPTTIIVLISVTHRFDGRAIVRPERLGHWQIGNRNRELPTCSAAPPTTASSRDQQFVNNKRNVLHYTKYSRTTLKERLFVREILNNAVTYS